ncbi:MAG: hypothetical protein NUV80_03800 [Candidatus Berkelbacteria bacterium]|nr:hypothetical protein [Candidatus Berkelbacteria bacterium]
MDSKEQRRRADLVKATFSTPGWQLLEEELTQELQLLIDREIDEDDLVKSQALKSDIRAIKRLFTKIQNYLDIQT